MRVDDDWDDEFERSLDDLLADAHDPGESRHPPSTTASSDPPAPLAAPSPPYAPYPPFPPYAPYPPFPPFPPYPPYPPNPPYPPRAPCPAPPAPCPAPTEPDEPSEPGDDTGDGEPAPPPCAGGGGAGAGGGGGGSGSGGGGGTGGGPPTWGPPDVNGWQCLGVPITLPVTRGNWPARYPGAPDPATTGASDLTSRDVAEALRRLGALSLETSLDDAQLQAALQTLRGELDRLVSGFPGTLLAEVALQASDGAHAPAIGLTLMQQLLLLSLNPYLARVLGLYFVDTQAEAGVDYEYCLVGDWGTTPAAVLSVAAGLAPAGLLARGSCKFAGIEISAGAATTSLWRWTRDDAQGHYQPQLDLATPSAAQPVIDQSLAGLAPSAQPEALLVVVGSSPGSPLPAGTPSVTLSVRQGWAQVAVQVAGTGSVTALARGAVVDVQPFSGVGFTSVVLGAAGSAVIDQVVITGHRLFPVDFAVLLVGRLDLHVAAPGPIGRRHALLASPSPLLPLDAPAAPVGTFRHRDAVVDPTTLALVPRSLIDVEWPAPETTPAMTTGDPVTDPRALPAPKRPVGFVVERQDTGTSDPPRRLARPAFAGSSPRPPGSRLSSARVFRVTDPSLPDPAGGWRHRVAAFDVFGVLGAFGPWTGPLAAERIAAAATSVKIRGFDNTSAAGGGATPPSPAAPNGWAGGTLEASVAWSGAALAMYPDLRTARARVEALDRVTGAVTAVLAQVDLAVPTRRAAAFSVSAVDVKPSAGATFEVAITATPALTPIGDGDPAALLVLSSKDGTQERYALGPDRLPRDAGGVATLVAGANSHLVAAPADFVGQAAYLVSGARVDFTLAVPLAIPIGQNTARAQLRLSSSISDPFSDADQIIDPNGVNAPRPQPDAVPIAFTAPQRLVPPVPPTPPAPPVPAHIVRHRYYDTTDATGLACIALPFTTPASAGVDGFVLVRSPLLSLTIADTKRRLALGNAADPQPVVQDAGSPRADLQAWIAALPGWLAAYNRGAGTRPPSSFTLADVLADAAAKRAFVDHFHGGLLDDELGALADLDGNLGGYARVNAVPIHAGAPVVDAVDGTGFGRTIYKLAAVSSSGSTSSLTGAVGPFYTKPEAPPRPPVLYTVQPTASSIVVAWTIDEDPEVCAYVLYRGAGVDALRDLRWFGPDPTQPRTTGLAALEVHPDRWPSIALGAGLVDPRIVGLVADPRLIARDYDGSDMAEVPLPSGPAPADVRAVYRLSDYDAERDALDQPQAFNYWLPPAAGGIAQLKADSATQSRVIGLRIGLGRAVPVVVVVERAGGELRVLGNVTVRRTAFQDGVSSGSVPLDPNAVAGYTPPRTGADNAYAVVAVNLHGNRSRPSKVFVSRILKA